MEVTPTKQSGSKPPIIFFDGVCNLCNHFVNFLLRQDRLKVFKFASLQGNTAKECSLSNDLSSIILVEGEKSYQKSAAILRVLYRLGGFFKIFYFVNILPNGLLDLAYDFVAKNRYHLFGKRSSCRLPLPDEKNRFLD